MALLFVVHHQSDTPSMTCALRNRSGTDFMSDHHHQGTQGDMATIGREERFPVRSKQDIELAQHLVGHSLGMQDGSEIRDEQRTRHSPSPAYEQGIANSRLTPSSDSRHLTPRSSSQDRSQRENSQFDAPIISQSDSIPSGQACRYVLLIRR